MGIYDGLFTESATPDSGTPSDRATGTLSNVLNATITAANKDLTTGATGFVDRLLGANRTTNTNVSKTDNWALVNAREVVRNPVTWVIAAVVLVLGLTLLARK